MVNRRQLLRYGLGLPLLSQLESNSAFAIDQPMPRSKRFLLQVHLDSMCGVASGLAQPIKLGEWPSGFNEAKSNAGSNNPHLNSHVQEGSLIFHSYIAFLREIAQHMCLVAGTPQSLDHGAAFNLQNRGTPQAVFAPEWSMAIAQNMRSDSLKNPMVISSGNKTSSVPDIVPVSAADVEDLKLATRDIPLIQAQANDPVMTRLKSRFQKTTFGSILLDKNLADVSAYQLNTLTNGLAELNGATSDLQSMGQFFDIANTNKLLEGCAEPNQLLKSIGQSGIPSPDPFREKLKLAAVLAKTGVASGMTISIGRGFEDTHVGGADVGTARNAAGYWMLLTQFWQWVKSAGLQDDIMIVVTHDFTRTAYNNYRNSSAEIILADGKKQTVETPGRDHALAMGMMFINAKVPKAGRVGVITDNIAPTAGKDTQGGIDPLGQPYKSSDIVGSMLMRVFDDLFPTERMVRKHWPTFTEIPLIST